VDDVSTTPVGRDAGAPDVPGLGYHQLHRLGRPGWWRPLVGVLALVVFMFLVAPLVIVGAAIVQVGVEGSSLSGVDDNLASLEHPGPLMFGALLVSLAVFVPATMLATWSLHGLAPGFLASIGPRLRWPFLFACMGLAVVALVATILVSVVLPTGTSEELTAGANPFDGRMKALLLVALVLTPLQAAGEEYLFRGYLTQAFGGVFPTWVAVVGPAFLFALAHGIQDPPVFFDRFAFGLVAGVLVVRTGGLEAGIAMHVLNNWLAFGLAITLGDLGDALAASEGTWWSIPATLTQSLVYLGLALLAARAMGIADRRPAQLPASS